MANGEGSNTTKIVVGIIGGVLVLGLLCCVGGWFLIPKEKRNLLGEGVLMAQQMTTGIMAYDKGFADDFGDDGRWQLGGGGSDGLLLVGVGADVELGASTVADLQDRAWQRYANAFASGGMPRTGIAIGRGGARTGGADSHQGKVSDWTKNVVDVETLVARTGVAAPKASEFFESIEDLAEGDDSVRIGTDGNGIRVEVNASSGDDAPDDEPVQENKQAPKVDEQN